MSFSSQGGSGNHAPGLTYDKDGRVTADNLQIQYTYDAESRPIVVNGAQILYDAFGRAVEMYKNGAYTQIVYGPSGDKFAYMSEQSVQHYSVPLAGGVEEEFNSAGLQYVRHTDWLGSSRAVLSYTGSFYQSRAYAPYGEAYAESGSADRSFTGQTQDTDADPNQNGTTGLYDFLFRQYSPSQSRWIVPDPAGLAAVDLTNPQTWNRYAYVGNNPLSNVDPLGLDCVYQTGAQSVAIVEGDCHSNTDNGYYYDCDGCLMHATSGYIDANGALILTIGQAINGGPLWAAIPGFGDTAPDSFNSDYSSVSAGTANSGFLSLRKPGQSVSQCIQENMGSFSLVGLADKLLGTNASDTFLGNLIGGNDVTGVASIFTGGDPTGSLASAVSVSAENGLKSGIGTPLRIGGNTAPAFQTLFPRLGRPAQALLRSKGLSAALGTVGDVLDFKLEVDVALTAGLLAACR